MAQTITMKDVYGAIVDIKRHMVSKEELARFLETVEILHNPETMKQVRASDQDIRAGRTKPVRNVKDLLAEMQ
ncbi:hypothetical protein J4219_04005 [Candidatus Woesearchaeota archaeon]|nr:hypothetical protein [Candidatus Woesearchaeota archaeon]